MSSMRVLIGSPISTSISSWCRGMNLCSARCVASSISSWLNGTPPYGGGKGDVTGEAACGGGATPGAPGAPVPVVPCPFAGAVSCSWSKLSGPEPATTTSSCSSSASEGFRPAPCATVRNPSPISSSSAVLLPLLLSLIVLMVWISCCVLLGVPLRTESTVPSLWTDCGPSSSWSDASLFEDGLSSSRSRILIGFYLPSRPGGDIRPVPFAACLSVFAALVKWHQHGRPEPINTAPPDAFLMKDPPNWYPLREAFSTVCALVEYDVPIESEIFLSTMTRKNIHVRRPQPPLPPMPPLPPLPGYVRVE
uniref:Uncharacterized protein n=1 Tax=Anopheles atroparvus TaxID=41427 RepID=A0A182JFZ9_ANOAO